MSDFLSIGASAINVYRQAIATTSNNISNVNTEGYSKQEVKITESYPTQIANYYLGTGAFTGSVQRSYDEFVERSLRDSASDLDATTPFIEYTQRIVDIMGSETSNLANAIDAFFNANQLLSVEPASIPLRNEVLNSGSELASRFNMLSAQVDSVAAESKAKVNSTVSQINGLADQLLAVNKQLGRKSDVTKQPPQLMDQRDLILRKMASLVTIGVNESDNGEVSVNLGGPGRGFVFVDSRGTQRVGIANDSADPSSDVQLVLDPRGKKQPIPVLNGGELGGLLAFRSEVVAVVRDGLDHLAVEFAANINETHRQGVDLRGSFGGDVFSIAPSYDISTDAVTGDISVAMEVIDYSELPSNTMRVMYRESSDSWLVFSGATVYPEAELSADNAFTYKGLQLIVSGQANDGDTLTITPRDRPATTFAMTLNDPYKLAASEPMSLRPAVSNSADLSAALSYIPASARSEGFENGISLSQLKPNRSSKSDFVLSASNNRPVLKIDAGSHSQTVLFDIGPKSDQKIQIFTAESAHLAGTSLTSAEATALKTSDGGFNTTAAYSSAYLNKSGTDAYLDNAIRLGAIGFRTERPVDQIDPITGSLITESVAFEAAIASGAIPIYENTSGASEDYIADGTLSLNGNALGPLRLTNGEVLSAAAVKEWLTDEADRLGISDVTIEASNTLIVNEIDPSKTLEINGESISFDPSVTMAEMVDIINASTNDTNVRTEWLSDSSFKLVNAAGHAGENIELGGTDSTTALNLRTGVYTGRFSIASAEQDEVALTIASGQPSDMGRLGFYTGIYSDQPLNEELAVFVTGTGAVGASITNSRMTAAEDTEQQLPAAPYKINFTAESVYTITDIATDTVVATRAFEYGKPIEYRGTSISFEAKPSKGDEFFVEANSSPAGNNKNLLVLMEWSKRPIISGQTFTEAYLDLVTGVGSRSEMTELRQEALQVVYDQAYNSREQASGVNLDDEAANLIRFQQAYQAAAQVVQASQKAFDILMRIS